MARIKDPSWLLGARPITRRCVSGCDGTREVCRHCDGFCGCHENKQPTGELNLWWAVIRQAAGDLRYANRSVALDALEFLRNSGVYLLSWLYGISTRDSQLEIAGLVHRRNKFHNAPLNESEVRLLHRGRIRR